MWKYLSRPKTLCNIQSCEETCLCGRMSANTVLIFSLCYCLQWLWSSSHQGVESILLPYLLSSLAGFAICSGLFKKKKKRQKWWCASIEPRPQEVLQTSICSLGTLPLPGERALNSVKESSRAFGGELSLPRGDYPCPAYSSKQPQSAELPPWTTADWRCEGELSRNQQNHPDDL